MGTLVGRDAIASSAASDVRVGKALKNSTELIWHGKHPSTDLALLSPFPGAPSQRAASLDLTDDAILIDGDNREVLSALLQDPAAASRFARGVKLCYLDPPYNTGDTFSTYRDSTPTHIWLEELRHLLIQVRALLTPDGSVWLHLDDNEQHRGRLILDEVFGADAFVATVVWQKRTSRDNRRAFSSSHDYIHVYAPLGPKAWRSVRNGLPNEGAFSNPDKDPRGPWRSVPMTAQAGHATAAQFYTVTTPTGMRHDPPPGRCWTYSEARLAELAADGRIYWPRNGDGRPRLKRFVFEVKALSPSTLWTSDFAGDTTQAKREILREFPGRAVFDTPKPELLMSRIVDIGSDPGDLVLDPFLGSGTTAVVALSSGRRVLGIEQNRELLNEVAVHRIQSVTGVRVQSQGLRTQSASAPAQEDGPSSTSALMRSGRNP